ncbi:MAG: hypothetical protein ACLP4V_24135 [Methylocella sp.]
MRRELPAETPALTQHRLQPAAFGASAAVLRFGVNRITLQGFTGVDQRRFTRSLEVKLAELAAAHRGFDWSTAGSRLSIKSLNAGALPPGAGMEEAAQQVAAALFVYLTGRRRGTRRV